ncbi:LemA family protein [Elizabethkingia meningoseptica]|uniref:LemA family protein n=1 Tax=Elizabethkingia meningoseptica TaxID=238 RepID=UPI003016A097
MKKILLIFLASIILLLVFGFVGFYGYKSSVLGKLKQQDNQIEKIWGSLYKKSLSRILVIESLTNNSNCNKVIIDSIIDKNKANRSPTQVEDFWNLEYEVNKAYLNLEKCIEKQPNNKSKVNTLKLNAEELNKIVDEYNSNVLNFNKYYSTFPNFMFGSKEGIRRKKFFYLKYGENNDDYYNQKKKTDKWIETGK